MNPSSTSVMISAILSKTNLDSTNAGILVSQVDGVTMLDLFNSNQLPTRYCISTLLNDKGATSHLSIKTIIHGNVSHSNIDLQMPLKDSNSFVSILNMLISQRTTGTKDNLLKNYLPVGRYFVGIKDSEHEKSQLKNIEKRSLSEFLENYVPKRKGQSATA